MKELLDFLLDSKDALQRHDKITKHDATKLKKKKITEEECNHIKKMAKIFTDEIYFTIPTC